MPEEKRQKYKYEKVAKKGYLYKNDRKREGTNDPDYKGKIVELDLDKLKDIADENNMVAVSLSGWIEKDQKDTDRVGIAVQKAIPIEETETAEAAASPF